MRNWLARNLPSGSMRFARLIEWHLLYYVPRAISSVVEAPIVHPFKGNAASRPLQERLAEVNVRAVTKLCRVMTMHESDKGRGWHNYTTVYSKLLDGWQDRALQIFEMGIGSGDQGFAFTMGPLARPGASLRGWREWFPHARIYGADIDKAVLFKESRIKTFYCDQLDADVIESVWANPELRNGVDLIIDDGLHTFEGNTSFLRASLEKLRPEGYYFIEDIESARIGDWCSLLSEELVSKYAGYQFALVTLPNKRNPFDNTMLVAHRPE